MATQRILFTVAPRAMAVNSATLPVSIFVSPRLSGDTRLGAFPDWLDWTAHAAERGLKVKIRCGQTREFALDTAPLQPRLWRALFNEDTLVRSDRFDDFYTDRSIVSFSARAGLSVLKSTYQEAGIALALPERPRTTDRGHDEPPGQARRRILRSLLEGLAINWNDDAGERLRAVVRAANADAARVVGALRFPEEWLAPDGTFALPPKNFGLEPKALRAAVAQQFGAYSHMPQGTPLDPDHPPDFDQLVDFHQGLSSLASYPELLRALGLVFDLDLPVDFVAPTSAGQYGRIAVVDLPGQQWAIATTTVPSAPPAETAYLHWHIPSPAFRLFTTAPAVMDGSGAPFQIFGLLLLDAQRHGVAQVDLESGLHKATLLAESWQSGRPGPAPADRPDVFDETTTLPSLRSGGFSLFADWRGALLAHRFERQKNINADLNAAAPTTRALFAEDLAQGYRVDVWDSRTGKWHSLHQRRAHFDIHGESFDPPGATEGFAQLAAAQPAPGTSASARKDLYLNESMARWAGWSLSVPFPGLALSEDPDPAKALDPTKLAEQNAAATPFKVGTRFEPEKGSLPALRFGQRYRFRLRPVDLAGNSMLVDDPAADLLGRVAGLPRALEGMPYLRFEPVDAPAIVLRDREGVTGPGSQIDRLVIRTFNSDISKDGDAAALEASDRHIVPPSTSVEMGERLGMFDTGGKPNASGAMYALIAERDEGRLPEPTFKVAGLDRSFPQVTAASIDVLPYLPDPLSRGAALRDLPGATAFAIGRVAPGPGADTPVAYVALDAANPRPGSATLVSFADGEDWQKLKPFRIALADGSGPPHWDAAARVLTVSLTKGSTAAVPMSSYLHVDDLKLMGVWQWLREAIDRYAADSGEIAIADASLDSELIAHILQRAQEGGHWMLTPPRMLHLVHAVQQPIGTPRFVAIPAQHEPYGTARSENVPADDRVDPNPAVLQTVPEGAPTARTELASITAWRRPVSTDAFLLGGLEIHAASTGRIELLAEWEDPVDALEKGKPFTVTKFQAVADEFVLPEPSEGYVYSAAQGASAGRAVAYYDADHGLLCWTRAGDLLGNLRSGIRISKDAAPRHQIGDTKRHRITYTARATSRFREYFDPTNDAAHFPASADPEEQKKKEAEYFSRTSAVVNVDVPASARPAAPQVSHAVPTFGWQRQADSNIKRSVRFGGGLRIYLERPWFSSGMDERLGVALYNGENGLFDATARERWKAHVTQWGADPIWDAAHMHGVPQLRHLLNPVDQEASVSLPAPAPGRVDVAGYEVAFDSAQDKWYADIAIDTQTLAYTPFVRLVLVRYQPLALPDAKLSAPVVADFMQLTPERAAVVSADPYHARTLRVTVTGPAPHGHAPAGTPTAAHNRPTLVSVTVQTWDPGVGTDLGWRDAPAAASVMEDTGRLPDDVLRWTGTVTLSELVETGRCRLMIREFEYLEADPSVVRLTHRPARSAASRLIYAETVLIDSALIGPPTAPTPTTLSDN